MPATGREAVGQRAGCRMQLLRRNGAREHAKSIEEVGGDPAVAGKEKIAGIDGPSRAHLAHCHPPSGSRTRARRTGPHRGRWRQTCGPVPAAMGARGRAEAPRRSATQPVSPLPGANGLPLTKSVPWLLQKVIGFTAATARDLLRARIGATNLVELTVVSARADQLVMSCRYLAKFRRSAVSPHAVKICESGLRHRSLVRPTAALPVAVG